MVIMAGCNIFLVTEYIKFRNEVTTSVENVNTAVGTFTTELKKVGELPEFSTDSLASQASKYIRYKLKSD
jgi:hypothetical protein